MRSQQGPLQASIDERSEEPTELVGMLAAHYELINKAVTKIMTLLGGIYED